MHSFHPSRGRIIFEVFCALVIAASSAMAWLQTGASALLAIAGVAAVYSLVHATDARRPRPAIAALAEAPQPLPEIQPEPVASTPGSEALPAIAEEPKTAKRKGRSRKKAPAPEAAAVEAIAEPQVVEIFAEPPADLEVEDEVHMPVAPLFEPQPLARQQRTVFGRKAGLRPI